MSLQSSGRKSGRFVLPGERLGVIEEFIPDAGTYVRDGVIHSRVVGRALLDLLNKRVSVYPLVHGAKVPKNGSVVLGQVSNVQTQNATMRIFQIDKKQLSGFFTGILHISDVRLRYVESMFDVCKPGDILRAKVISEKNRTYHLSTKDKNLGVVHAFCLRCGYMLELKRQEMRCPRCGKIEKRKAALDYGEGAM
ncbi:MAG: exosome complex RNA-binding protein Csl4 [Candidatus Bathyarchaeota archaeon]|nr:exosome complex RNA-binding protein Csl4 [Candidatus Bathyarchaeota archaeon]MDH5746053.1 exosome complex RNA-binding protein Csl4 [Candidatus Bathyarchaeota archaeon]